jgi:hypothetical protein
MTPINDPSHRTGMHLILEDLPLPPRPADQRAFDLGDHRADHVVGVQRLVGGRAHLPQHDETMTLLALDGGEEQQVGEAQVGQHLPRRHEPSRVRERHAAQRRVRARQLEPECHRCDRTGGVRDARSFSRRTGHLRCERGQ